MRKSLLERAKVRLFYAMHRLHISNKKARWLVIAVASVAIVFGIAEVGHIFGFIVVDQALKCLYEEV